MNNGNNSIITTTAKTKRTLSRLLKIAAIVGLICFLLPFVCVSCETGVYDGEDESKQFFSPAESLLARFGVESEDCDTLAKHYSENGIIVNVHIIISFIALATVLFQSKKRRGYFISMICGIISAISLLIFRLSFMAYYKLAEYEDVIVVRYEFGWFFVQFMSLAVIGLSVILFLSSEVPVPVNGLPDNSTSAGADNSTSAGADNGTSAGADAGADNSTSAGASADDSVE